VLEGIRGLLERDPRLERQTSRIRLVDFGSQAMELELFAYVLTGDVPEFLAVREDLLLRVAEIVESSGTGFAQPALVSMEEGLAKDGRAVTVGTLGAPTGKGATG
jgi:MscS family membrane protein